LCIDDALEEDLFAFLDSVALDLGHKPAWDEFDGTFFTNIAHLMIFS
jgi:mannose/cellobiose epimerase-like protein (N-acyl-D-glucosamine 2-epimerase family)